MIVGHLQRKAVFSILADDERQADGESGSLNFDEQPNFLFQRHAISIGTPPAETSPTYPLPIILAAATKGLRWPPE
jgi:hypothetical protein